MPRVLITGAAGFIGMHTSIRFLKEGWDVDGLDNMNYYYSVDLKKKRVDEIMSVAKESNNAFHLFEEDLNSNIWNELSTIEYDAVVHLAAQAGVRYSIENPRVYLESNVLGFQNVIEFVDRKSINRFVYASSSSVYGKSSVQPFSESEPCNKPESYYAATKKSNELMAHSYYRTKGINSIGLRFFTVYGPWGRPDMAPFLFANAAFKEEGIKVFNHGNQKRDFTFISDIVEGVYLSIKNFDKVREAEIFNIGYGAPTSLMDFIAEIEATTGKKLQKSYVEAQLGDVEVTYANTHKFKSAFGYSPEVGLTEGVSKFIDWLKSYNENTNT
jgi:UDP-glucuronate 4-epimerase